MSDKINDEQQAEVPPPANKDEAITRLKRAMMYWNERAERSEAEISAAQAEIAALREDAERWRWLVAARMGSLARLLKLKTWRGNGSDHNAAIDAERKR